MHKIINTDTLPVEDKIFFDEEYGNIIRVDQVSHRAASVLLDNATANTWFPNEINMAADKTRFFSLPEDAKRAFMLNIIYQIILDSGVTSGISEDIIRCVSTPIWDLLYRRISYEESIHSQSYSKTLMDVFGSDTTRLINETYSDSFVKRRMDSEVKLFGNLHEAVYGDFPLEQKKEALLKVIMALLCLEAIKFPFSFLVTFTINDSYKNAIPGFTNNIRLIAHDELNTHVPTGILLIRTLRKEEHQGFSHFFTSGKFEQDIKAMVKEVVNQEVEWAGYLFDNKDVKGINTSTSEHFIKWRGNILLSSLGFEDNEFSSYKENSITNFFDNCRDVNKHNMALQESDNTSYQKGALVNDL